MELQQIKNLLIKHLQSGPLPDAEGEQLLAALDQLIYDNQFGELAGIAYKQQGVSKVLTIGELEKEYWEIAMYYGDHEDGDDHHHHHDHDDEHPETRGWLEKWSWLLLVLAFLLLALIIYLIRRS